MKRILIAFGVAAVVTVVLIRSPQLFPGETLKPTEVATKSTEGVTTAEQELARQAQLYARIFFLALPLGIVGLVMALASERAGTVGALILLAAIAVGCWSLGQFDATLVP